MTDLDARVFLALHDALSGAEVVLVMAALSVLGSGWAMFGCLPLLVLARTRRFATALVASLSVTAIVVFVLKQLVSRPRPYLALAGVHTRAFAPPTDFSFPSGHAAGSFAFASFVALVLVDSARRVATEPRAGASSLRAARIRVMTAFALFVLAASIGVSRIALGVHFPGDVLAGAVVGSSIGGIGATAYLRRERARLAGELPASPASLPDPAIEAPPFSPESESPHEHA